MKIFRNGFLVVSLLLIVSIYSKAQSYLGSDGGLEGTATIIDNASVYSTPQAGKWSKEHATITLANETVNVRSGTNALKVTMTFTTMQRIYTPVFTIPSDTNKWYVQFYIKSPSRINTQVQLYGYIRGGTEVAKTGDYDIIAVADTWEKFTYAPTTKTAATTIAGVIKTKAIGNGGDVYIDDFCIYAASTVDNTAPNLPSSPVVNQTSNSGELSVSWTAASGGVDSGGYLVIRKIGTAPTGTPNVNGIYSVGNTIGDGTVAYIGTSTNFTDTGLLTDGTTYSYAIFTFDKAYNYSSGVSATGTAPLAVQLASFTATVKEKNILLVWTTATETNNFGFEIERKPLPNPPLTGEGIKGWGRVAFVEGSGTSNAPKEYSYTERNLSVGKYLYRLKQIDRDGKFEYSKEAEVIVGQVAKTFELLQNYPNPFNPTTTIEFTVPSTGRATLKIFNTLGQEVTTLYNREAEAGVIHQAVFDASKLTTGLYFSRLEFNGNVQMKKLLLLK